MPQRPRRPASRFEDICRTFGVVPSRVLRELHRNGLLPKGADIDVLDVRALAHARAAAYALRMRTRTSKLWVAGYPNLVAEWHPTKNIDVFPDQVRFGSHLKIWWKCPKGPDHEWQARPNGRTSGRGCPFCAGQRPSVTNCLATVRPDLASLWHPTRNGKSTPQTVTALSHHSIWWKCAVDETHLWRASPSATTGCPFCAGKRVSRPRSLSARAPLIAKEWHSKNTKSPHDVFAGAEILAWWQCPHGHEWQSSIRNRALRGHGCPVCAHRPPELRGSLASQRPDLAREWHPKKNAPLEPSRVSCGSPRRVWWKCAAGDDHEWQTSISNRVAGTKCPYCAGRRACSTNSLAVRFPDIAREWHSPLNGELEPTGVVPGASRKVWWCCENGHVWNASVVSRSRLGTACPSCAVGRRVKTRAVRTLIPKPAARRWRPGDC